MSTESQIITIAPGISLTVDADANQSIVDNITERYHRGNRERELRDLIAVALAQPDDDNAYNVLFAALDIMGYISNRTSRTPAQLAAVIEALIPLADVIDLVHACEQVEHEMRELRTIEGACS